jgi:hypothetical protein
MLALALASAASLPCDIFAATGSPCVAAHSVTRALFAAYAGPLYAVTRASDNKTVDVSPLSPGGVANAPSQDAFCARDSCVISAIYDQTLRKNHLTPAPAGGHVHTPDAPVNATRLRLTLGGSPVYGAYFEAGNGYRIDNTSGVATGNEEETIYMVTSGTHFSRACCFECVYCPLYLCDAHCALTLLTPLPVAHRSYGNAETNNKDNGLGAMEALNFGNMSDAKWARGTEKGPWVMVDLCVAGCASAHPTPHFVAPH